MNLTVRGFWFRAGVLLPNGRNVNAHEISSGAVYKHSNVTVTAFATTHAVADCRIKIPAM